MTIDNLRLLLSRSSVQNIQINLNTSSSNEPAPSKDQQAVLEKSTEILNKFIPKILSTISSEEMLKNLNDLKMELFQLSKKHFSELDNKLKNLFKKFINLKKMPSLEPENWAEELKESHSNLIKSAEFKSLDPSAQNEFERIASKLVTFQVDCYPNHMLKAYGKIVEGMKQNNKPSYLRKVPNNQFAEAISNYIKNNYIEELQAALPFHMENPCVFDSMVNVLQKANQSSPYFRLDLVTRFPEKKEKSDREEQKPQSILLETLQKKESQCLKKLLEKYLGVTIE